MAWIVNIKHCLTEDGLPGPGVSGKHAVYYSRMVAAATSHGENDAFVSAIDCSRRPGRKPCDGKIALYLHEDGVIEWQCDRCAYNGFLSGWQGTMWDLSKAKRIGAYEDSLVLGLSEEDYCILRGIDTSSIESRAAIAGALATLDEILVVGDDETIGILAGDVLVAANCERNRKKKVVLNAICDALESLLDTNKPLADTPTRELPIYYN